MPPPRPRRPRAAAVTVIPLMASPPLGFFRCTKGDTFPFLFPPASEGGFFFPPLRAVDIFPFSSPAPSPPSIRPSVPPTVTKSRTPSGHSAPGGTTAPPGPSVAGPLSGHALTAHACATPSRPLHVHSPAPPRSRFRPPSRTHLWVFVPFLISQGQFDFTLNFVWIFGGAFSFSGVTEVRPFASRP